MIFSPLMNGPESIVKVSRHLILLSFINSYRWKTIKISVSKWLCLRLTLMFQRLYRSGPMLTGMSVKPGICLAYYFPATLISIVFYCPLLGKVTRYAKTIRREPQKWLPLKWVQRESLVNRKPCAFAPKTGEWKKAVMTVSICFLIWGQTILACMVFSESPCSSMVK